MKQSLLFSKTRKDAPKDEVAKNAELLIRAGFAHKDMAGVYSFLPLGLRVLNNICNIIRSEMNAIGGQEVHLASLQEKEVWQKTGRWDDTVVDNWFKTQLKHGGELGLATTHEEPLTALMTNHISSYRDLPMYVYQFQTKFRNEARAKSGVMRGREFLMKDLYSFSKTKEEHDTFYEKVKNAYISIFKKIGIGENTHVTFASGGSFAPFSHEFQTETDAGEDIIYIDGKSGIAVNKEVYTDEVLTTLGLDKKHLVEKKAVEVGNIFTLGTRFSEPLGLLYSDESGEKKPVFMGSYGIGPARVLGVVVETLSDDKGIVWPTSIAPFQAHLISIGKNEETLRYTDSLYKNLLKKGIEVLLDDRDVRAGEKFADSDLIGIPYRVVVSDKTVEHSMCEVKKRTEEKAELMSEDQLVAILSRNE